MTRNAAVLIVLLVLFVSTSAGADGSDWQFRCDPFLGLGATFFSTTQVSLTLGLEVLTFPDTFPVLAGKDFGGFLATVGDDLKAAGLGIKVVKAGDYSLWLGGLLWSDESVRADAVLFVQKPFTLSLGW